MKISIGSDHAGFKLKEALVAYLAKKHQVLDMGTYSDDSVDYPDYAFTVSKQVADREVDFGILICYTGIGMSISANKVKGIRAACFKCRKRETDQRTQQCQCFVLSGQRYAFGPCQADCRYISEYRFFGGTARTARG